MLPFSRIIRQSKYRANAVLFDGTNDYAKRDAALTGQAVSKKGIFSCWFRITGANGNFLTFFEPGAGTGLSLNVYRWSDNKISIVGKNAAATTVLNMASVATYTNGMRWAHLLAAWDLGAGAGYLYVNDVDDRAAAPTLTDDTLAWSQTQYTVGGRSSGTILMQGDLADFYLNTTEFLDISIPAIRRRFISQYRKPVFLGTDGRLPTGTPPMIFLSNPLDSWQTNLGTGGGFNLTGTLTASSSSPSD